MIRLRTLGSLDLRNADGQALRTVLAQPKRVALLTYLALAIPRGFHRRDTLLTVFWPEQDAEHGRNALTQAVYFLRHALGAHALVAGSGDELGLAPDAVWCDAIAFEDALDERRPGDALGLYQGELLEGLYVAEAPEFEQWLQRERMRLGNRYAGALESTAVEREAAGDFGGAVMWWRRLAARDVYSSRIALRLAKALAAAGEPAAAVRHARAHEALLRQELGVTADPELEAFVRQLRSAKMTSREPPHEPRAAAEDAGPIEIPRADSGLERAESGNIESMTPRASATPAGAPMVNPPQRPRLGRRQITAMVIGLLTLVAVGAGAVIRRSEARVSIRSLAVLPLENISGDPVEQRFAEGMHDALVTELGRYPDLSVISRTSVLQYRGTKKSLRQIARELAVDAVVEGALLRQGGRVRVTAQLIDGRSDRHLWARSYEGSLGDALLLQSQLAHEIARQVRVVTRPAERLSRRTAGPPDSVPEELYLTELYLRGRRAELSRSQTGVQTAMESYRRAVERDSTFALGYAGLAAAYGFMADYDYAPVRPSLDSARMMAERAVALDSSLPETRAARGVTLGDAGEFAAAEREFQRALVLGPSNARAHYWYSVLLVALGRGHEALREAERSMELDPLGPRGVLAMKRYATYLNTGQRPHLRLPITERRRSVFELEPGEPWAHAREAMQLAQAKRCDEARAELSIARRLVPGDNFRMQQYDGTVWWWCGERARARALVRDLKQRPDAADHGFRIAWLYMAFGEKDSALVWLPRHRWTMAELTALRADAVLDPLRADPRFTELLRGLGVLSPAQN